MTGVRSEVGSGVTCGKMLLLVGVSREIHLHVCVLGANCGMTRNQVVTFHSIERLLCAPAHGRVESTAHAFQSIRT